jgi:hypothetical protein
MANVITRISAREDVFAVLPSAARTAAPDTQEFEIAGAVRGLIVVIDATAVTATPALTVTVAGVDRRSGKTYTMLASAAIATVSTTVLRIAPGLTAAANLVASDLIPPMLRITCAHGDSDSITYSINALLSR